MATAERDAKAAVEAWGGLGIEQTIFSFRWLALFPLLGMALQRQVMDEAMNWARQLLVPPQQRLPDELKGLLESAVVAWEQGHSEATSDLLNHALQLAHTFGYI